MKTFGELNYVTQNLNFLNILLELSHTVVSLPYSVKYLQVTIAVNWRYKKKCSEMN